MTRGRSKADRLKEQAADLDWTAGARPNEPPDTKRDVCPKSLYGRHRFTANGGRCCEWCGVDYHTIPEDKR